MMIGRFYPPQPQIQRQMRIAWCPVRARVPASCGDA